MQRLNIAAPAFGYDPARPDGYRRGSLQLGPLFAADQLAATVSSDVDYWSGETGDD